MDYEKEYRVYSITSSGNDLCACGMGLSYEEAVELANKVAVEGKRTTVILGVFEEFSPNVPKEPEIKVTNTRFVE